MLRRSNFTREERERIVREFIESDLTSQELAQKYGVKDPHLITIWHYRLRNSKKSSTFAAGVKPQMADEEPMKKQTPEELEAEVKRLTKELEWAKLQNKALNTLIDIAESQGIRIRKKSGAKQ